MSPSCRTSTSGTWLLVSGCGGAGPGQEGPRAAHGDSVPTDQILLKMPSTLTAGGPGERARPLQVRSGSCAPSAECLPPLGLGAPKAPGGPGRGAGQGVGVPLTRALCVDMEVLYWKHVKEQLETLRKLQRREASTGHRLEPAWSQVGDSSVPHRCCLHAGGGAVAAEA